MTNGIIAILIGLLSTLFGWIPGFSQVILPAIQRLLGDGSV